MNFICDGGKCASNFRKTGASGNLALSWNRCDSGIMNFLLVFASNRNDVMLKDNVSLQTFIDSKRDSLMREGLISDNKYLVRLVSFHEVFNGGVHIPDLPGYYSVYPLENETVYYDAYPVLVSVSVRLEFSIQNHMNEISHLFRKSEYVYSGYKRIIIHNGIRGVVANSVRYRWADGRRSFPIPKSILENGGEFFVLFDENEKIEIYSLYDGIEISQRGN